MADLKRRSARGGAPDLGMMREFLDAVGAAVVIITPQRQILHMNEVARRTWGSARGRVCHRVLRQGREACPDCPLETVLKTGDLVKQEVRMQGVGGEWRTYENVYFFVRGPSGDDHYMVMVGRDVQQQKSLEREVMRAKELSRALLDSVNTIVLGFDSQGRPDFMNRAAGELLGASEEDLFATDWIERFIPAEAQGRAAEYFEAPPDVGRMTEPVLIPLRTASDERRMISWTYTPLVVGTDDVEGALALGQDVTERYAHRKSVEKLAEELTLVNRILAVAGKSSSVTEMLEGVLDALLQVPGYRLGGAYLLEKGTARLVASRGFERAEVQEVLTGGRDVFPASALAGRRVEIVRRGDRMHPYAAHVLEAEDMKSASAVPVSPGGHPVGLLVLCHSGSVAQAAESRDVLSAAAEALELGGENVFLRARAEGRAREAASMLQVTQALAGASDLSDALGRVAAEAAALMEVDLCSIFLLDERTGLLHRRAKVGWTEEHDVPDSFPLATSSMLQAVAQSLKPLAVEDPAADPRLAHVVSELGVKATLAVPLITGGRFIGAVILDMTTAPRRFGERELELMENFASQAAAAIHNATLVQEVKASEERYRTLVETSRDAIFLINPRGMILFANSASNQLTGLSPGELVGRSVYSFVHPDERDTVQKGFHDSWELGKGVSRLPIRVLVGGSERLFEASTAIIGEPGPSSNVVLIASDVTEREIARRRLAESEQRYRAIVEKNRDAIVVSNRAGEVLYANPQVERVMGIPVEEVTGQHLFQYIHPDDRERVAADFVNDWKTGQTIPDYPIRCVRPDGAVVEIEATSGLVGWPAEDAQQVFVLRDVTERRAREADREMQLKVEEALAAVAGRFVDPGDVDEAIQDTLEGVGELLGGDGCFYAELSEEMRIGSLKGWSWPGKPARKRALVGTEMAPFEWFMAEMNAGREVVVDDAMEIGGGAEREMLEREGVRSLAAMPVFVGERMRGFIGYVSFDKSKAWSTHEVNLLREIAKTVSRAMERREFVEELGRSERFRKRITESIGEGLLVLTNGAITWVNRQAAEMFGYDPERMYGRDTGFLMHEPDRFAEFARQIMEALSEGGIFTTEDKARRSDGSIFDVFMSITELGVEEGRGQLLLAVKDITREKVMREEISAAAEAYSTIFSSAGDALIVHTIDGDIRDANEVAKIYTGYEREELLGLKMADLVPVKVRHLYEKRRDELQADGSTTFETVLESRGGARLPVEVTSRATSFWGEEAVLSSLRDISERKRAAEEVARRAFQLGALNEIVKAATSSLDVDTAVDAILEVAIRVTGATSGMLLLERSPGGGDLVMASVKGAGPSAEGAVSRSAIALMADAFAEPGAGSMTARTGYPEGPEWLTPICRELSESNIEKALFVPLKSGGKLMGLILLGSDEPDSFGERDREFYEAISAEIGVSLENALIYRELTLEHERLSLLYRSAQSISGELDLETLLETTAGEAARAVGAQAALIGLIEPGAEEFRWAAAYGLGLDSVSDVVLCVDEGIGGVVAELKRAVIHPGGQELSPEMRSKIRNDPIMRRLGSRWGAAVPLISGDKVVGVMGLHMEEGRRILTGEDALLLEAIGRQAGVALENARLYEETRRHLEAIEKAHQELMVLDRMKSDFVSTVSHELRSPLAVIEGFAKTMVEHFDRIDRDTERESLEIILKKSIALEGLIENILDMSRIEEGRLDVFREEFELVSTCARIASDQELVAEVHRVVVDTPGAPVHVVADREKLEVALGNLVRNAVKFSPEGGRVTIGVRTEGKMAVASVTDEGIGIPPGELERIFDRFYQVDSSETRSFPGTGLGLYITKELVEAMGGSITVESRQGEGSTFTFTVPLAR